MPLESVWFLSACWNTTLYSFKIFVLEMWTVWILRSNSVLLKSYFFIPNVHMCEVGKNTAHWRTSWQIKIVWKYVYTQLRSRTCDCLYYKSVVEDRFVGLGFVPYEPFFNIFKLDLRRLHFLTSYEKLHKTMNG